MARAVKNDILYMEQVEQLLKQTVLGVSSSIINAIILSFVLWGATSHFIIILWFISIVAISLIRMFLQYYFQKVPSRAENIILRRNIILISLIASGIIWGSSGVFLFPDSSIGHQVFIAFIIGGMIAGSVGAFSVIKKAFLAYSIPALLPILIMFFQINDEIHYAMGTMLGLFWLMMFLTVKRLNKEVIKSLNLKYENLGLITDLEKEVNERKKAEEALLKRNQEIEEIVHVRTVDLKEANKKLMDEIEERRKIEKALNESKEKYKELANSLPQIVFEMDIQGKLTFVNRNAMTLFGYNREEFEKGFYYLQMLTEEERERAASNVRDLLLGMQHEEENEYMALRKDGGTFPIAIHANPIIDDHKPVGCRGIVIDLTEKKKDEKEKNRLELQLLRAQKMEAIGTLAGGVAHDLNNILSGIVSYPDLLLMDISEDSPMRKPILTMKDSGIKAAAIVQDLLTLTRRGVVNKEIININLIINKYLESPEYIKMISFHSGIQVDTDLEKDLCNISGSSIHLMKTVMNLVSNAAEAIHEKGKIHISTKNRYIDYPVKGYDNIEEGDYVELSVSDTGIGISSDDLERIFEPFFTKKVMGRSGTGLGMAVVWGTVKDHDGYIDVGSVEGEGTIFTLFFPVTREEISSDRDLQEMAAFQGKGESILVVDDVKEQRTIASDLLSRLGYRVSRVSKGEDAIKFLKKNHVDLIVLDMIMEPGIDGLETYKRVLEINSEQKTVIASGYSETDSVKEAQRLGAGAFIQKPYTIDKIGPVIRNELDKSIE